MSAPEPIALPLAEPVALGLSGGADSVALLLRCLDARQQVLALHYNHALPDERGDEAEAFVRALCARLSVPLAVGRCEEPWPGRRESREAFARRHRMAFFANQLRSHALRTLLLAHQADDRAETAILRLARGSAGAGLTGFSVQAPLPGAPACRILRPLLGETHASLVAELRARDQAWFEDPSNADLTIPRNALRRVLVPTLPHFTSGVNAALTLLAEDDAYLEHAAQQAIRQATPELLELAPQTPSVLARRALRAWLAGDPTGPLGPGQGACARLLALPPGAVTTIPGARRIRRLTENAWIRLP